MGIWATMAEEYIHAVFSIDASATREAPNFAPIPPNKNMAPHSKIAIVGVIAGSIFAVLGSE